MKEQDKMTLASLARGAVNEAFEVEMGRVLTNIADPNTDPKAARKIVIEIVLKPDQKRQHIALTAQAKSTLAPAAGVETSILLSKSKAGDIIAQELQAQAEGQLEIDMETGELKEVGTRFEVIHSAAMMA